jgi:hypothetical protein
MMKKNTTEYPRLLKILASVLEKLTDEDIRGLLAGELNLVTERRAKKQTTKAVSSAVGEPDITAVEKRLSACDSREEGRKLLSSLKLKKASLLKIAEGQGISVRKGDTVAVISDAIVECFIGFRLRDDAFKTIDLRGEKEKL